MTTEEPIVSWSTPVIRAERTIREIGEELETGSRSRALELIDQHVEHIVALVTFLQRNPKQGGRRP